MKEKKWGLEVLHISSSQPLVQVIPYIPRTQRVSTLYSTCIPQHLLIYYPSSKLHSNLGNLIPPSRAIFHLSYSTVHLPEAIFHLTKAAVHLPGAIFHLTKATVHLPGAIFHFSKPTVHPKVRFSLIKLHCYSTIHLPAAVYTIRKVCTLFVYFMLQCTIPNIYILINWSPLSDSLSSYMIIKTFSYCSW